MLCQPSPDARAGGHRLVTESWRQVANGRLVGTWHGELTLQGTYLPVVSPRSEVVPPPAYRVPGHPE